MKLLIAFFAFTFLMIQTVAAQTTNPAATSSADLVIKLNDATGKIDLVYKKNNAIVTQDYALSKLELTIFDANGEYAGTLNLNNFVLPKNEVDATEKLKVASMQVKHTASGQSLTISNVEFTR